MAEIAVALRDCETFDDGAGDYVELVFRDGRTAKPSRPVSAARSRARA
jgi:hypothetical protein